MLVETLKGRVSTATQPDEQHWTPGVRNQAATNLLLDFVRRLDDASVAHCILHGYEDMPASWHSDIDFCVERGTLHLAVDLLETSARRTGWAICNLLEHEQCALGVVLARQSPDGAVDVVIFDICSDYRYNGVRYIESSTILAGRRRRNGLWVPAPHVELSYLLVKRTLKRSLSHDHLPHLYDLYRQNPAGADRLLRELWNESIAETLSCELRSASPRIVDVAGEIRGDLRRRAVERTVRETPQAFPLELLRLALRTMRPIGLVVAVLGPDGAGKTTVIAGLDEQMTPLFRRSLRLHFRPRLFGAQVDGRMTFSDPHGKPNRSMPASVAKLGFYAIEHILAHLVRIRPKLVRGSMVLFDRGFDDIRIDPRRYRYSGPLWMVSLFGKALPPPDYVIVLDAPVEVLHARKQEVSAAEAERQRTAYRNLATTIPNSVVIDASRPLDRILADANGHLLDYQKRRIEERMRRIGGRPWTIAG